MPCKNKFPYCGAIILTNLILHYVKNPSYKFQLFRAISSEEQDF
jgi:hypothetical protein